MCNPQSTAGVLVIVSEAARVEEFHDRGSRRGFHPHQRCETVSMNAHHDLYSAGKLDTQLDMNSERGGAYGGTRR